MNSDGVNFDNSLLVTQKEINDEARPCQAQQELADRCIEEAQMLDIKPAVGDTVYMRLFNAADKDAALLFNGGVYTVGNETRVFAGLRKALLYYAYARIVRASGGVVTRFDYVRKTDAYSDSAPEASRTQAYQEAFSIADGYKADALRFMRDSDKFNCFGTLRNNRLRIKKIGY